jgi:hypothetical protein
MARPPVLRASCEAHEHALILDDRAGRELLSVEDRRAPIVGQVDVGGREALRPSPPLPGRRRGRRGIAECPRGRRDARLKPLTPVSITELA